MAKLIARLVVFPLVLGAAQAATVLDYEKRVFRAVEQIERIKKDVVYAEEGVGYVRKLLPATETVETDGRQITVDNHWLHSLLDRYKAGADAQKRLAILNEAAARLRALDEQIRDGDKKAVSASSQAHDEIRTILARPEYGKKMENPVAAYISKLRRRVLEFLQDLYERIMTAIFGAGRGASWIFRGLVILAVAGGVFVAVKMVMSFRRRKKPRRKRTVLGEEIEAGTTAADLANAARAAASAGDFRTAIRKLYVSLLFELADRGVIELESSATNHEYLARVSRFSKLVSPMTYLTDRFDYFWYGMFESSADDFSSYLGVYDQAMGAGMVEEKSSPS